MNSIHSSLEILIQQMTTEEKAALFQGVGPWHTKAIERLGIPALKVSDGPYGCRTIPDENLNQFEGMPANCYPTGSAMAATWNPELIHEIGIALGEEAKSKGVDILLGPAINIQRTPLGGRNFEYFTEDPYLNSRLAVSYINGVQSQGVGTSLKHFVCNNQEFERDNGNSEVDERTLHEIYLPGFKAAVTEAQPWTVMCAYNKVNGTYASENHALLTKILKQDWQLEGAVVSDWGAVHDRVASAAGGMDLQMPGNDGSPDPALVEAVETGVLSKDTTDDRLRRWLLTIERCKAFNESKTCQPMAADTPQHRELSLRAAEEAMTLLKNDGILPLKKETIHTLAVLGPFADTPRMQGGGSANITPYYSVSPLQGLQEIFGADTEILHAAGVRIESGECLQADDFDLAVKYAKKADTVILCVGMADGEETEMYDRSTLEISKPQLALMDAILKINPHTVILLSAGAPVQCQPWIEQTPAVLLAWYPGQECGRAAARILTGATSPSGKLPMSFPKRLQDNPTFLHYPGDFQKVHYGEGIFVGYRYYDTVGIEPQFSFGHGLSYTQFDYQQLEHPLCIEPDEAISLSFTLSNTGSMIAKETTQIYIQDVHCSVKRPLKELKAFKKIELNPGESQIVHFTLPSNALAYYDPKRHDWVIEPGEFKIMVGSSSRDIRLEASFQYDPANIPTRLNGNTMILKIKRDPLGKGILSRYLGDMSSEPMLQFALGISLNQLRKIAPPDRFSPQLFDNLISELEALD